MQELLGYLLTFPVIMTKTFFPCNRVSEYESENRMSISNLAIVFGPCLLWPKITNAQDLMTDVMLHNRVIEGLLLDYQKIFSSKR